MRTGIPQGDMGKKREKEDCVEMLKPPDKRGRTMQRFRNPRRRCIKQSCHGSHPPHHQKRRGFCRSLPPECHPGIGSYGREQQSDEYSDQIKAKQKEMVALIAENAKVGDYTQEFDEQYRKIAEEISTLKEEQAEVARKKKLAENYEQRVKDMDAFISASTCQIPEFDNDLVRRLIASIRVISADRIEIQFQSGIVMEQEIVNE